ncbi:putative MATE family efflux protein [Bacillus horti]|uniref:Probable multidrug resistance protein NorM n=2 Tax=Caldalkalibacillus horti TaxID=77523 RepID=A0ABT9W2X6_9BACI|nr:putative MATE family efflux protein [Bacillus horti]
MKIINLTIPTIIAMSSTTIMGIVNLIIVGSLGYEHIGAVGITNVIILNLFALFGAIGYAINYLVAQHYGAKNYEKCVNYTYTGIYLTLILSIPILICSFFAPTYIYKIIGASETIVAIGTGYLSLRLISFCFTMFRTVFLGFIRAIGDTKSPMYSGIIGNVLNIVLSYVLVFGMFGFPELGILGAGWAFLIAEIVQTIYVVIYFYLVKELPTRQIPPFRKGEFKIVSSESAKIGLEDLGMSAAMILFTAFAARLGDIELAATEIALNVLSLAYLPGIGFGTTATILIGQKIGEKNNIAARLTGVKILKVGAMFLIPLSIVYFFAAEQIARLFTDDTLVIEYTVIVLMLASFFLIIDGLQLVVAGALRGVGENTYLMKTSLLLGWVFFVPLTYLLTFVASMGLLGMWIGFYVYIVALFVAFIIKYRKIEWGKIEIRG